MAHYEIYMYCKEHKPVPPNHVYESAGLVIGITCTCLEFRDPIGYCDLPRKPLMIGALEHDFCGKPAYFQFVLKID